MKKWQIESDGVMHEIQYKRGLFTNKIIVDGEIYKVKSANKFINVLDYGINFGSTQCYLVVIGSKIDLAVNGIFLKSGEPYKPVSNVDQKVWVFVGISTLGGLILSGYLSFAIGLLMSTLYIQHGLKKKNGALIGCFIACSVIQLLIFIVALIGSL